MKNYSKIKTYRNVDINCSPEIIKTYLGVDQSGKHFLKLDDKPLKLDDGTGSDSFIEQIQENDGNIVNFIVKTLNNFVLYFTDFELNDQPLKKLKPLVFENQINLNDMLVKIKTFSCIKGQSSNFFLNNIEQHMVQNYNDAELIVAYLHFFCDDIMNEWCIKNCTGDKSWKLIKTEFAKASDDYFFIIVNSLMKNKDDFFNILSTIETEAVSDKSFANYFNLKRKYFKLVFGLNEDVINKLSVFCLNKTDFFKFKLFYFKKDSLDRAIEIEDRKLKLDVLGQLNSTLIEEDNQNKINDLNKRLEETKALLNVKEDNIRLQSQLIESKSKEIDRLEDDLEKAKKIIDELNATISESENTKDEIKKLKSEISTKDSMLILKERSIDKLEIEVFNLKKKLDDLKK